MKRFVVKGKPQTGNQGIRLVMGSEPTCTSPPASPRAELCATAASAWESNSEEGGGHKGISGDQPSGNPGCNRRREPAAGSDATTASPDKLC